MTEIADVAGRMLSEAGVVPAFDDLLISSSDKVPLVDPGRYDAVCVSCRKERRFHRNLLSFKFRLVSEDRFFGSVLPGYCNLDFGRSRQIPARSKIGRWLRIINSFDARVSARRFHLSVFGSYQFVVEVGTTEHDHVQQPFSETDQYAKVREILAVVGRLGGEKR